MFNKKLKEDVSRCNDTLYSEASQNSRKFNQLRGDINLAELRCAELERRLAELYLFLEVKRVHYPQKTMLEKVNEKG